MYTPPVIANLPFVLISTFSERYGIGAEVFGPAVNPITNVWVAANRALYVPLYIDRPMKVVKLWTAIGTTGATGTVDVGLYSPNATLGPGTLIVSSGSTAQGTASTVQEFDIADTAIVQGVYWLGMSASSGAATYISTIPNIATFPSSVGVLQEAAAHPLPSTATGVACTASNIPMMGIAVRTLVA